MKSKIAEALAFRYGPVAVTQTDEKPEGARQFKEGKFGCVMSMLAAAAMGKRAVFDRKTFGCPGGGTGLGFGNQYRNFPGSEEAFCYFLSVGNHNWEPGRALAEVIKPFVSEDLYDDFVHGEAYAKSPELVRNFLDCLPITDVPVEYVAFSPLKELDEEETPEVVVFLADMDQFSALVVLANYARPGIENVIIPYVAGCQSIAIYPFREAQSETPRAVAGLVDISARVQIKRQLKADLLTFAAPFSVFREMEENVEGSFLERNTWKELIRLKKA